MDLEGRGTGWSWFLAWSAVGACVATGFAAILSVGPVFLALAAAAGGLLLWKGPRRAVVGGLVGLALPLFYVGYLNRGGPGDVCTSVPGGQACTEEYAPVPFLVAGVLLCTAGFAIFLVIGRGRRGGGPPRAV